MHQGRERIAEVFVLAAAKAMLIHDDAATEAFFVVVEARDQFRLSGSKKFRNDAPTLKVEMGVDHPPVHCVHSSVDRS
jgi:hypothetical protein